MASRSIRDWRPDGEKGIWILARNGMWFYGAFDFPCDGLPFENSVGFLDGTTDELDKFGGIATRHAGKCKFKSFVTSAGPPPPPPKKKPAAKGATAAAPAPTPDVQAAPAESAPVPATDQGV